MIGLTTYLPWIISTRPDTKRCRIELRSCGWEDSNLQPSYKLSK